MAIKPDSNDLYIVTSDGNGGQGATIFHAKAFAKALPRYSHKSLTLSKLYSPLLTPSLERIDLIRRAKRRLISPPFTTRNSAIAM